MNKNFGHYPHPGSEMGEEDDDYNVVGTSSSSRPSASNDTSAFTPVPAQAVTQQAQSIPLSASRAISHAAKQMTKMMRAQQAASEVFNPIIKKRPLSTTDIVSPRAKTTKLASSPKKIKSELMSPHWPAPGEASSSKKSVATLGSASSMQANAAAQSSSSSAISSRQLRHQQRISQSSHSDIEVTDDLGSVGDLRLEFEDDEGNVYVQERDGEKLDEKILEPSPKRSKRASKPTWKKKESSLFEQIMQHHQQRGDGEEPNEEEGRQQEHEVASASRPPVELEEGELSDDSEEPLLNRAGYPMIDGKNCAPSYDDQGHAFNPLTGEREDEQDRVYKAQEAPRVQKRNSTEERENKYDKDYLAADDFPSVQYDANEAERILAPIGFSTLPPNSYQDLTYARSLDVDFILGRRTDIPFYDTCPTMRVDLLPPTEKSLHFSFFVRHNAKTTRDITADGCGRWTSNDVSSYRQKTEHYFTDGIQVKSVPRRKGVIVDNVRFLVTKYRGPHPDAQPKGSFYRNVWKVYRIHNREPVGIIIAHYELKAGFERIVPKVHGNAKVTENGEAKIYTKAPPSKLENAAKLRSFYSPVDIESMINTDLMPGEGLALTRTQIYNQGRKKGKSPAAGTSDHTLGQVLSVKQEHKQNMQLAKTPYTFLETFDGKRTVRMYIPQESILQAYASAALTKARTLRNVREGWLQIPRDTRGSLLAEEQPTEFLVEVCGNLRNAASVHNPYVVEHEVAVEMEPNDE